MFCIILAWLIFKYVLLSWCQLRSAWKSAEKKMKNYSSKNYEKQCFNYERTLARTLSAIRWNQFPVLIAVILLDKQIEHREEIIVHLGLWHYVLDFIFHILWDGDFSWTLNSRGHLFQNGRILVDIFWGWILMDIFCPREFYSLGEFSWTFFGWILADTFWWW